MTVLRNRNTSSTIAGSEQGAGRHAPTLLDRLERLAGIGYWTWDSERPTGDWNAGRVEYSRQAAEIFGVEPADLILSDQDYIARFVHADDRRRVEDSFRDHVERRRQRTPLEYRILRPDGTVRTIVEISEVIVGEPAAPMSLLGIIQDLTQQRQAEAKLRESEARLRHAQQMARLGHWTWTPAPDGDPNGDRSIYSEEGAAILGVVPADLAGPTSRYMERLVHPDDRARLAALFRSIREGGESSYATEYRIVRPDGTEATVHEIGECDRNAAGRLVRVRGTIQDISERRRTEEELRKSEARLLRAQRIGKAGNWEWEARHNRVIWSREALRIFGLPEDSVRRDSMDWTANIHPDDRNTAISAIEDIRRDGQPRELEYRVVRPDGSIRHVLEQLDARLDAEGKINRISGVVQDVTDHKMTELALRDSEARLRSFIENAPIGMSIKTVKGRYLMVNRLTADLLGDKPETIIGRTAADYWSPDEVRRIEEHEREVRDKGAAVMREMHVRERPGAPWFYELKFPLHDAAGRITAIGGALIDITPQKQAQAALQRARDEARKHEQRLVDAIESLDDAFSLHDSAGRLVKFNDRYRRAFPGLEDMIGIGVTYEETISAMVARGLAPEAKGREAEWIAKRVADHRDGGDRFEFRTADGRWLLISERRTHDGGVVSIRTDITTRKMAEEALRRSEARLRSFLENVPATMTIKDRERRYLSLNTLAAETMGRAADEFHGRRIEDIYSGPGAEVATAMDLEALETGKPVAREVHYLPSARFGLSYDVKFPIREGNRVVGIGGIGFDISELKRTEQRLTAAMQRAEAANLAKSQFLANMSHELRTPLNAVIGFSEIMAQEAFGPLGSPRYLDYLKDILASGRHLLEIVDDVLDTARIESGAVELRSEPVDLPALVETCRHMISIAASNKGLTLEAAVDGGLPPVIADGKRLRQCLLNLLSNAVKFTPSGGRIVIAAERGQDGGLCLKVTDTGIGILHDRLPLIFRPFSEVENAYAREHGGAGLGLFLTKSLVEAHGGGITVESMSGEGTTVTISLPTSRWATDQVSPA